ncbi:hypothetical protein [Bifidobacterium sp. SO1]|uniref:hypothetical protein n=1 Tax=Bifidobacterium sp. SO1 TaxID=2809029 RepID=UPI001BDDC1AA|nr:hypothetical protein [Bifidobacterium sp. SO1]MBT1162217.1 hypothetical protein [Bifidobacterium sp. SO1]
MHTLTLVIAPSQGAAENQLEPYAADLDVEPYIDMEKEDWINEERDWRKHALTSVNATDSEKTEYARLLAMDDDTFAQHIIDLGEYEYDEDGNRLSTYNPDAEWDWYETGGRWEKETRELQGITVEEYIANLDDPNTTRPCDVVTEYEWYNDLYNDKDQLIEVMRDAMEYSDDELRVWFYDCHM